MKKIHLFIIAWNEENIIGHTINFYREKVSHITLYDNCSTDNTVSNAKEAYPGIEVISFNTSNRFNDGKHVEIKNQCWQQHNWGIDDWAIIIDADEWLWINNFNSSILFENQILKRHHSIIAQGYQAVSERINFSYGLLNQVKLYHDPLFSKAIAIRPALIKATNFMNGAHSFYPEISDLAFELFGVEYLSKMTTSKAFNLIHMKYIHRRNLYHRHQLYVARLSRYNYAHRCGLEYTHGKDYINDKYSQFAKLIPLSNLNTLAYRTQV